MRKNKKITYSFNDILFLWLHSKRDIKIQSFLNYENLIKRHLSDSIGKININDITQKDIENYFEILKDANVAVSTMKKLLYITKASLLFSYKLDVNKYIDLSNIKFKKSNKSIFVLSKEEQIILERKLKENINIRKVCLLLCLYTGIRVGEVCGLKWEDIDFSNKSLRIKRTIERIKNIDVIHNSKTLLIESTPKTDTSNRMIPIPNFLIDLLYVFKGNDNFYILSRSCNLYDPRLLESFYSRILKLCNIKHNKFHTLRHTFATRSIESKMDIKTLSEILGHSSIEITMNLYVHPSYELKKSSIENLVLFMNN